MMELLYITPFDFDSSDKVGECKQLSSHAGSVRARILVFDVLRRHSLEFLSLTEKESIT